VKKVKLAIVMVAFVKTKTNGEKSEQNIHKRLFLWQKARVEMYITWDGITLLML
jgi:hypothetical protein